MRRKTDMHDRGSVERESRVDNGSVEREQMRFWLIFWL